MTGQTSAQLEAHNTFVEALGAYWDLAWAEGRANREHDTPTADAQKALAAIYAAVSNMLLVELAARAAGAVPADVTDQEICRIAELTINAMPEGILGFVKTWGWQQFARTLVENLQPYGLRLATTTEQARHD